MQKPGMRRGAVKVGGKAAPSFGIQSVTRMVIP